MATSIGGLLKQRPKTLLETLLFQLGVAEEGRQEVGFNESAVAALRREVEVERLREKTIQDIKEFDKPPPEPVPEPPAKKRKGRQSTILTSSRGIDDDRLGIINRPQARSASLLGG